MYEKAAENLDKAIKKELGDDYTTEDLLRFQMKKGLITPKSASSWNLKNEFDDIKEAQSDLPPEEQRSDRNIADQLAAENNCSLSTIKNIVKD